MANVRKEVSVNAGADAAWKVVGDTSGVHNWLEVIQTCEVDGDTRTCGMAGGGKLVEKILSYDDAGRRYEYTITEGMPVESHKASFSVTGDESKSTIVWEIDFEPEQLAAVFEGAAKSGLEGLRKQIEG